MKSPDKLYKYHQKNLKSIEYALKTTGLQLRSAVASNASRDIYTYTRLYSFLLAAWTECRLNKLLFEANGFTEAERKRVQNGTKHLERWELAIDGAFRKHYNVPRANLSIQNLPHSAFGRLTTLREILEIDLRPVIELRNKLAHGQWEYPLNSEEDDVSSDLCKALKQENILSLQYKHQIIHHLTDLIHDLVVSKETFERDFDDHFNLLLGCKRNLDTRSYEKYAANQRAKFMRGRLQRNSRDSRPNIAST